MNSEETPAGVPALDKQAGEARTVPPLRDYGAEPGVWSERMLAALEQGVKGNKWFSLIDKVYADRTLGLAWAKVSSNAGACGVDGVTVERFGKDSQSRLIAVNEHLNEGSYQPALVKRVMIACYCWRKSGRLSPLGSGWRRFSAAAGCRGRSVAGELGAECSKWGAEDLFPLKSISPHR